MRIALIIIFIIAAGVLITVIAASEAISVAAAFMESECCGNCKYHVHDDNGDGMCVNADSDACADWTDDSDICGKYAEKGDKRSDTSDRRKD